MSYEKSASVYDAIYEAMKDYASEAARVTNIIREHQRSSGEVLIDIACGTGLHAQYFIRDFTVYGVDASPAHLAIAADRLPGVPLTLDVMQTFNLDVEADAIVCLFSAIGHLTSIAELEQTIANFERQLKPGGVIVIEPWLLPHMWHPGHISFDVVDEPELKVARIGRSSGSGNVIHLVLEHLVARSEGNEHFTETHELTMFSEDEFNSAFSALGLASWFDVRGLNDRGRGVFIATKPLS